MFTGIIEQIGIITNIHIDGTNKRFEITSPISNELKIDQSVSHDGVCLTVEKTNINTHTVTAISETLKKTNLNHWEIGTTINLERCLSFNGRIDGHIVQGHVDSTAICTQAEDKNGSWEYRFKFDKEFASMIIEKGSITINGISLTIFNISENEFSVAIIPYTYHHTNISEIVQGSVVNIEFDIIGKYVNRIQLISNKTKA